MARERLTPIRDKFDRAKKVYSAYQDAVARKDFPVAARLARTLSDEYTGYMDSTSVLFPVAVHSLPPGAEVRVDGKPVGLTPCTVLIPCSRRTPVRLTHEGFNPADVVIDDPGKGVCRVYLERTPLKRIQIPGEIHLAKLHEKDCLVLILKGGEGQKQYTVGVVTLSNGYFRDLGPLGLDSVEADTQYLGTLYFSGSGRIASVAPTEGKVRVIVGDAPADAKALLLYVERAPLLANKIVVGLIVSDGRALGYKIDDGEKVWEVRPLESLSSAIANKEHVLATGMGKIVCLDRISAKQRWASSTGELLAGPAISAAGWFGYIDARMMVAAGNPSTGDMMSQAQLSGIRQLLSPIHFVVADDAAYLASQEFFYILKPGKGVIADTALDRKVLSNPVVSAKSLYLVGDGALYRVQKDTARPDWRYESRGSIVGAIVTGIGLAVVENTEGRGGIVLFDE